MANFVTIGRRLIPTNHIAFVEPFDPNANPDFQTSREFKARLILINRDSLLTEQTPHAFAEANGLRMLPADRLAINPSIPFHVETFAPSAAFTPTKPFASRLLWRDPDGREHSRLLLSDPETVLSVAVTGEAEPLVAP